MRDITKISIHISDSKWGSVKAINEWHLARGWNGIGYHYVILNGKVRPYKFQKHLDGVVKTGRKLSKQPACVYHHNKGMIGIVLIGKDGKFTHNQIKSLIDLVLNLMWEYKIKLSDVKGHYEYKGVTKACPQINMDTMRYLIFKRRYDEIYRITSNT